MDEFKGRHEQPLTQRKLDTIGDQTNKQLLTIGQEDAQYRNFDVETSAGDILFSKDGQTISVTSFLPAGYSIVQVPNSSSPTYGVHINHFKKRLEYEPRLISSKFFPLIIFHEIGHALRNKHVKASTYIKNLSKSMLSEYIDLLSHKDFGRFFALFNKSLVKESSDSERQSRYLSYTLLKKLQDQGRNVFDGLPKEEIFKFINMSLLSYKYSGKAKKHTANTRLFSRRSFSV